MRNKYSVQLKKTTVETTETIGHLMNIQRKYKWVVPEHLVMPRTVFLITEQHLALRVSHGCMTIFGFHVSPSYLSKVQGTYSF